MSNIAGVPNQPAESRRFRWQIAPAFALFVVGGFLGLGGAIAITVVLYHVIRNSWSGVATAHPTVNQWVPVLLLSYALMLVSGFLFIVAAYWCGMGRWRAMVIAALLGVAAWAGFFRISPGGVPL